MVMNSQRSLTMSSISALKVALASKRESRVLLGILLSFVFCLSSLKINVFAENNADSDSSEVASQFFAKMNFFWTELVDTNTSIMSNNNHTNIESPSLYVSSSDPVYIVYSYFAGQQFPSVVGTGISQSNQLVNGTLYAIRFTGSGNFKIKFASVSQIYPIYVGGLSQMPNEVRALIGDNELLNYVGQNVTNTSTISTKLTTTNTRLSEISGYSYSINGNLLDTKNMVGVVNNNITTTNNKLDTTNNKLTDIQNYFVSNNTTTNNNVTNNNTQKSNFDTKASTLATFESTQGTDLDTNLQSLNISSNTGLLVNSSFVKSALWVNSMFDRLIVGSPFELILVFCLSIGIAFAMIGKVR